MANILHIFNFLGGAAGGGYSQVIPMEEVCNFFIVV